MEIPLTQVKSLLVDAGADRVGSDAVEELAGELESAALTLAKEAKTRAEEEGRVTVTGQDVKMAAGRLAVHTIDSPIPPTVVPEDVVERHFHLAHDDLDEVIKKYWKGE